MLLLDQGNFQKNAEKSTKNAQKSQKSRENLDFKHFFVGFWAKLSTTFVLICGWVGAVKPQQRATQIFDCQVPGRVGSSEQQERKVLSWRVVILVF
jgi:hypothetical protein